MRSCIRNLLLASAVALLGGWAIIGAAGAPPRIDCGIAAWTGTCACTTGGPAASVVSLPTLARSLNVPVAAETLNRERHECGPAAGL